MSPNQIIAWRGRLDLTQAAAAALIDVDRRTWARWEGAERQMPTPIERLLHIAETVPAALKALEKLS